MRADGVWTDWADADGDAQPDATGREGSDDAARDGTDPIVAMGSDGLQVRASSPSGPVTGLRAVLVDPGTRPEDSLSAAAAVPVPGAPAIYGRALWGADESLRTCGPEYSTTMASAAVHHTASTNSYTPDQVPGILRGFLAYHTRPEAQGGRGWCDIGYNFLVDKFGRIFEGRAGGTSNPVVGVHTGGFNSRTIGIAAIGDYTSTAAPAALMDSLTSLIAWKFALHGIRAGSMVTMISGGGASKWPEGTPVTFSTIYGHRDAQLTGCPGAGLYDRLPELRARVAALADAAVDVSPRGVIEAFRTSGSTVTVSGWAVDPEHAGPLTVQVLRDNVVVGSAQTTGQRPDVAALYPGLGGQHGFATSVTVPTGTSTVCVRAVNVGQGTDVTLGCRAVTVRNALPFGSIDALGISGGQLTVSGWAIDPDTTEPTAVHVYVDGVGVAVAADASRPDVAAVYGLGDRHGYRHTRAVSPGLHTVCLYVIDTGGGAPASLGCDTVGEGYRGPETGPIGVLDTATASNTSITVTGWAFDPNWDSPTSVHVYVDSTGVALAADGQRPDVAAVFRRDARVGFSATFPAAPGAHSVCAYGIDFGPSGPSLLGCTTVVVRDSAPIGSIETTWTDPTGFTINGWALDPDTTEPTEVHAYVDGVGTALRADRLRPDVAAVFGRGDRHGYSQRFAASPGTHQLCLFAINTAPLGPHTHLGCYLVTV